jgi:signal transduction histidine kinase/CheY-like chemotaxis protein
MLESLQWRTPLRSAEAQVQLAELRADALRFFVYVAASGYLLWHLVLTTVSPPSETLPRAYLVFLVAGPVLGTSYVLLGRSRQAATAIFVGGGLLASVWALYVFNTGQGAPLIAMLVLIAAFVIHPLGGLLVAGAAIGLLTLLGIVRPGLLGTGDLLYTGVLAVLAVVGVAALTRHLFLALNWYADSYARAEQRTREAEEHRAQLAQALKQLDSAYYRLERANAALQVAWKAADEAERSKTDLVTNISHELRTPLNLIIGFSEMMMTAPGSYGGVALPPPYRIDLNAVYRSAQHLLALTDDILDLARLEIGHLGLIREPVDLGEIVRDALSLVRDYAAAKRLDLRLELAGDLSPLLLDRLRIRQVLLNLLTNAVRVTEHGGVQVRLVQHADDVEVTVTDTGPGIAPADQSRIFERFVTRDPPGHAGRAGTGLGLPISKTFIVLHGGEMGVESTPNVGTTFWFTLPVTPVGGTAASSGSGAILPGYLRQHEQVLVLAEPEPELVRLFQRHLEGFRVEVANDLAEAEATALELKASAIVADVGSSAPAGAGRVPVVRCPFPRAARLPEGLAVAGYLVKPISREALLGALRSLGCAVKRILIVDNDAWFGQLLHRMLAAESNDYLISTAQSGEAALARMQTDRPDLVLLDLAMPGLDGVGTLRQMAAEPGLSRVKVIVISAYGEGEGTTRLNGEIQISKPDGLQPAELTRLIAAIVSQLTPVRAHLPSREPTPAAGRSD